jgi:hypothetical protein
MNRINKLAEKIIGEIKKEKIEPASRWRFVMKDSFFWGIFVLSVVIGGMTVSVILNTLLNNDWELYMELSGGLTQFIVITLPYFWLIFLGIFMLIAYINIMNTKKAYRQNFKFIVAGAIFASFLLGLTFYNLGLASSLDKSLIQKLPPRLHQIMDSRLGVWQSPDKGFLVGEIKSFDGVNLELVDFNGDTWQVVLGFDLDEFELLESLLQVNKKIRIKGELDTEKCNKCFSAFDVRPLDMMRGMIKKQLEKMPQQDFSGMMIKTKIGERF